MQLIAGHLSIGSCVAKSILSAGFSVYIRCEALDVMWNPVELFEV